MKDVRVDIQALAKLARLEVPQEELRRLEHELPEILGFVETIQAVDVSNEAEAPERRNVMRADENPHASGMYTEKLLSAAPFRQGNRIAVKQVISRQKKV